MSDKSKKTHCILPYMHLYAEPTGLVKPCCIGGEFEDKLSLRDLSVEEAINSPQMKQLRKDMSEGIRNSVCMVCYEREDRGETSPRENFNKNTLWKMPKVGKDFSVPKDALQHIDIRFSNLCNFKCRMCGDQLSSSWEAENKKHLIVTDAWLQPNTRRKISNFQVEVLEEELQAAVDQGVIEEIYWVGGEPLMWERHWTIMQQLVDSGQSKDVTVRYNTNLSRVTYKKYDLYKMLDNFKNVNICASIDAIGDIGEYIRTGLKWDEFLDNFNNGRFLIDRYGQDAIVFDVTLTTPGLFGLKDMFDKVTELDVKSYFKFTYAFDPTKIIAPTALPKHITIPYCQELIEYMEPRKTWKTQIYIDSLKSLMNRKSFDEEFINYKEGLKRGKNQILFLEKIREQKLTFRDILNEPAKEWWDGI